MTDDDQEKTIGKEPAQKIAGKATEKSSEMAGEGIKIGSKIIGKGVELGGEQAGKTVGGAIGGVMGAATGEAGAEFAKTGQEVGGKIGKGIGRAAGKSIEKTGEKTGDAVQYAGKEAAESEGIQTKNKSIEKGGNKLGIGTAIKGMSVLAGDKGGLDAVSALTGGNKAQATKTVASAIEGVPSTIMGGLSNKDESSGGNITSPEGVLMLSVAVLFDLIGLIPLVGTISDIFAGIIVGAWMITRKSGRKAIVRFVIALVLEAIPIVSDIAPFVSLFSGGKLPASWIGCVYGTLKDG